MSEPNDIEHEDICPETGDEHQPDWKTLTTEYNGCNLYVDVNCKFCGRSGCVGNVKTLKENISWYLTLNKYMLR